MKNKKTETILVVSKQVALCNSKINWPDMNYPGSGETILRIVYNIDYDKLRIQLDGEDGPWFENDELPIGVGFYGKI
jgi:hypothetical protein